MCAGSVGFQNSDTVSVLCHADIYLALSLEILHALKVIGQDGHDISAHHKGEGVRVRSRLTPLDLCAECMCYNFTQGWLRKPY